MGMVTKGCGRSGDRTVKLTVFEQMEQADVFHVDTDSQKLKVEQKYLEWLWSRIGVASLVMGF